MQPLSNGTVVIAMGGCGAGKSTVLEGIRDEYKAKGFEVKIFAPDDYKQKFPDYQKLLRQGSPNAATMVHSDSIGVAMDDFRAALGGSLSPKKPEILIYDGTGSWEPFVKKLLGLAERAGRAAHIVLVYADSNTCVQRAQARATETQRTVPEAVVRSSNSAVLASFATARGQAHGFTIFDNSGPRGSHFVVPPADEGRILTPAVLAEASTIVAGQERIQEETQRDHSNDPPEQASSGITA